jgi:N-acetyl-gamma-glutamyl-phosphate reductase
MNRGILATCAVRPTLAARERQLTDTDALLTLLSEFYEEEPFIVVSERSPSTKATLGSNTVHLTVRYDARTDTVLTISALDNLTKGASGAAVQNMNLLLGMAEVSGLATSAVYP